jgi:hypothetical protein
MRWPWRAGDASIGLLLSKDRHGIYYIENVVKLFASPHTVEKAMKNCAAHRIAGYIHGAPNGAFHSPFDSIGNSEEAALHSEVFAHKLLVAKCDLGSRIAHHASNCCPMLWSDERTK